MFKNLALCLILLFSFNSIALTNEEKARKLYVEANLDLEKNCPNYFTILDTILDLAIGFNFNSIKGDYNLNKINDLVEYQNKIEDSLFCYNFIVNKLRQFKMDFKAKHPRKIATHLDMVRTQVE